MVKGLRKGERLSSLTFGQARVRGYTRKQYNRAIAIKEGLQRRRILLEELEMKELSKQPLRYSLAVQSAEQYNKTLRAEVTLDNENDDKTFNRLRDYLKKFIGNRNGLNKMGFDFDNLTIEMLEKERVGSDEKGSKNTVTWEFI